MAPLTVFCCGCTLRSGAITAAMLTAIGSLASLFIGAFSLAHPDYRTSLYTIHIGHIGIVLIFSALVGFAVFACLIVALHKNSPDFLIPWLVCALISIVVEEALPMIFQLTIGNWIMATFLAAIMTLSIYMWVAVFSYFKELSEGRKGQGPIQLVKI